MPPLPCLTPFPCLTSPDPCCHQYEEEVGQLNEVAPPVSDPPCLTPPRPQYEEEVGQLNEVAHQKPRDALVQGIQQENRHLRELQQVSTSVARHCP